MQNEKWKMKSPNSLFAAELVIFHFTLCIPFVGRPTFLLTALDVIT
jgi:hypothetical protein